MTRVQLLPVFVVAASTLVVCLAACGSTGASVLALRGMTFQFGPGLDPRSPAFQQAAADCGIHFHVKAAG
jgi:hypothetical protein